MVTVGNAFLLPGATVATILMLGALHGRRLYEDKKVARQLVWFSIQISLSFGFILVDEQIEEKRERGIELEFHQDVKV